MKPVLNIVSDFYFQAQPYAKMFSVHDALCTSLMSAEQARYAHLVL